MTPLDITELCELQALLIRYRHEMMNNQDDEVFTHGKEDEELAECIGSLSDALDVVMDDIRSRVEQ